MSDRLPTLFCDGLIDAQVIHGVARITLGEAGADGKASACGRLVLPVTQLPAAANALANLVRQIQERVKEAQGKAQTAAEPPANAAFRFP
jgi:hypothetical protein